MSRIRLIGLTLVAALALSAVAVASASAAPVWRLNGAEVKEATTVKSKSIGKLVLSDTSTGTVIECEGTDKGTVGPGAKDEVKEITATSCGFKEGKHGSCEEGHPVTATAVHLPWKTELYEEGGRVRDRITYGSKGQEEKGEAPGWKVECTVLTFFKVQDECTGVSNTGIENFAGSETLPSGVKAIFDATTPKANCSVGGAGTGEVTGIDLNESPAGKTLTVS